MMTSLQETFIDLLASHGALTINDTFISDSIYDAQQDIAEYRLDDEIYKYVHDSCDYDGLSMTLTIRDLRELAIDQNGVNWHITGKDVLGYLLS
jgi:hypothetical protein